MEPNYSQQGFVCSNSGKESLENGVKYVQIKKKKKQSCSSILEVNLEHISHLFPPFLLLTLSRKVFAEINIVLERLSHKK